MIKIFSFFCGSPQPSTKDQSRRNLPLTDNKYPSQSISINFEQGFKQKVRQFQKKCPVQVKRYKKKQQQLYAQKVFYSLKQNVKRSLMMMDHKSYIRCICFSLWPKYMLDKLIQIEYVIVGNQWIQSILSQVDQLQQVFGEHIVSMYSNSIKSQNYHIEISNLFNYTLDMISNSQKWILINSKVQNFCKSNKYNVQYPFKASGSTKNSINQFKHKIQLLKKLYCQPQFSKKIQLINSLKPMIFAYHRNKLMEAVCEFCIYKTGLQGYYEMLQYFEAVFPLSQQAKQLVPILKTASSRLKLGYVDENPWSSQYIRFCLNNYSSYEISDLGGITHSQNSWTSLISSTELQPGMSIILRLDVNFNNFKVGIIGNYDKNLRIKDLSQLKQSLCLCLHSKCVIENTQKIKLLTISQKIQQIIINIGENFIQWEVEGQTILRQFNIPGPIRLHIIMKKGNFKHLPLRRM